MSLLITGSNGFIAQHIIYHLIENTFSEIIATSKSIDKLRWSKHEGRYKFYQIDISDEAALKLIEALRPAVIIHAAAMGSADECELNKDLAFQVNVNATRRLADIAKKIDAKLIFLSSDFVFEGTKGSPYLEEDRLNPVNYYGHTKLLAEQYIVQNVPDYCIVRLCAVYGYAFYGNARGIITITKQKLSEGKSIKVVADQYRTPTFVGDIASGIGQIITLNTKGIFHLSGDEIFTPYDMAVAASKIFNLNSSLIEKVSSDELAEPAKRPKITGFVIEKAKRVLSFVPTPFVDGILLERPIF